MEASDQYASSVVAIEGATGNIRWSYQTVHHDIWDYDVPSQPTLIDLPGEGGEKVKALLQPTKRGEVFVLNRETGEPLFDIQERPVPQTGGVPEDYIAATQPFSMDLPIWRSQIDESKMWGITPLDQLWCRIEYRKMRYEGHFTVPGVGTILQNPGATGGFNWGSVSVDEANNLMVVNPLYMANQLTLTPRDELPDGVIGSQLGTPYSHNTQRFMSPLHVPCMQPPYGTLGVVDLETKELLWQKPIGTAKETGPTIFNQSIATRLPLTVGTPQTGGTVTTAGGLIFSAGTFDNTVRATSIMNGEELWSHSIPYTAQGTPMTYLSPEGKQTVVVVVPVFNSTRGSGYEPLPADEEDPLGGYVFAFRLPD
jgi:quinate dehydrogenase (quinone)